MAVEFSIQRLVSDGTLSTITLGIQYLQRNDIYMRIAGEETPQSGAPSGYTWSFVDNTTLKILPVVPSGVEVVVYRRTDIDAMYNIYSQNAQFDEATIDENNQQLLFIAQEYLEQGIPGAGVASLEYINTVGGINYYRFRLTDGSLTPVFGVPDGTVALRDELGSTNGTNIVTTPSGLPLSAYLLKGAGIDPDMFPAPMSDAGRMQAAIDLWATDKTRFISLHRSYNVTGATLRVANVETEVPESQLVIVGGELKKLDAGYMFDKPATGQSQATGGIKFLATRFFGPKVAGTYILNGHHDFLGTYDSTHILRVSFVACMGYGIQVVYAKPDGYIQSISMDANCVWRQWAGYMIDCGFLFDVDITNPRFEYGDAVIKTRKTDGDPSVNSLKIRGGVIEGNSGASGRQLSLGTCYSTVIDGVYQEHNAGGDYEFNQQTGTFHKGLTIIGCGFQPAAAQLADPNYYPIELGQGAENCFTLSGNSSSGNLYNASTGNQAPVLDSSSWVASGFKKFGPLVRRKFEMKGEEFHAQVYDGAGGGLNYTNGLFFTDNVGGSRNYMGWGDQVPSSGGFPGVSFARGSIIYNKSAGVVQRQYGASAMDALIMGWQCVIGGTPGVWREIAILLPYA